MNNEIKVNLVVVLQGRTMMSEQECSENSNYESFSLEYEETKTKKKVRINTKLRGSIPATQSINLSKDAYESMIGECPYFMKPRDWSRMGKKGKLEAHLKRIKESLGGIDYNYTIFED